MRARARGLFAGMLPAAVAMVAIVSGAPPAEGAATPGIISTQTGGPGRGLVHNVAQEANWVATGPDGSVYVSDVQGVVRRFNDTSTWEKAIAGLGRVIGYGGDSGPATRARLGFLGALAVDADQNVAVADTSNNRIRMIAATSGTFGFAGDGSQATSAEMRDPTGVTVDGSGDLLISDYLNQRIRLVAIASGTYYGTAAAGDDIVTVAGNGVAGFLGDSHRATSAELNSPQATGVDGSGNLLIVDTGNGRVREVNGSAQELNR